MSKDFKLFVALTLCSSAAFGQELDSLSLDTEGEQAYSFTEAQLGGTE